MNHPLRQSLLHATVWLFLAGAAWSPVADARPGGGGGGHRAGGGGGGGAHAGARAAGGGGGQHSRPQVNNARADTRSHDVRHNSVNNVSNRNVNANRNVNVNSNRNVNVDVHGGGCCGWDNDWHPVATAAAVTATAAVTTAVVGSMVRSVPANCVPVNYGGMIYQQCGGAWYMPQAGQYVVVNPPY